MCSDRALLRGSNQVSRGLCALRVAAHLEVAPRTSFVAEPVIVYAGIGAVPLHRDSRRGA